jgi:hypothetical protein
MDTRSEFCARLPLETQGGGAPAALRGVMPVWAATLLETAATGEQAGGAEGERRESRGAVDATFFDQMRLVCMEWKTGYLLPEEVPADRTSRTWNAVVEERLQALGTQGL